MDLRGPISGKTGYVIVWFSRCHPQESVLWELRRRDCATPSYWIRPASQLAATSNNDSDLTSYSYCIASRLITEGSLCTSVNVSVRVCFPVAVHFRYLCICVEDCFSVRGVIYNLQSCCQKMRKRANPSNRIDVKQDKVDPYVTKATSFDSLSVTPLLTPQHFNYSLYDGLTLQMWR